MNFWDVVEVLWFPALLAIARRRRATWLIWYYTQYGLHPRDCRLDGLQSGAYCQIHKH